MAVSTLKRKCACSSMIGVLLLISVMTMIRTHFIHLQVLEPTWLLMEINKRPKESVVLPRYDTKQGRYIHQDFKRENIERDEAASHTGVFSNTDFETVTVSAIKKDNDKISVCNQIGQNPEDAKPGWKRLSAALDNYRIFHHNQLLKLKNLHRNSNHSNIQTLTWSCNSIHVCSGLGDQLYRIQMTLLLAIITKRVFAIHWNEESLATMQYLQPNKIDWSFFENFPIGEMMNINRIQATSDLADILKGSAKHVIVTNELLVPLYRCFVKLKTLDPFHEGFDKLGLLQILRSEADRYGMTFLMGKLLRFLFNFSPSLIEEIDTIMTSLELMGSQYLAVHIRTGFVNANKLEEEVGHFSKYKVYKSPSEWNEILRCSVNLADKMLGPGTYVYLATDSSIVKRLANERIGDQIKYVNMSMYHVSSNHKSITDLQLQTNHDPYHYTNTWIDFIMLARAHVIVRGVSGFSTNAGAFCSIPQARQCSTRCKCNPKRWYN